MAIIKPGQLSSGSYSISGSFSGSFQGDGSGLTDLPIPIFDTGSFVTTSSFNSFTSSYSTGSFTGSFTGSLLGTASYTQTSSIAINSLTASYVNPLNQNVQLTGSLYLSTPEVASIYFSGSTAASRLVWNNTDGTLDLGLKGGNVTLQVGQEQVLRVVNKTATNVNLLEANYQAVRLTGAQGQRLKVDLALATNDLLSAETIGLVTETINNNQEGFITTSGIVRGINTTGTLQGETWADGDVLYLSPTTAGNVTKVKPTAPNHLVIVGYVIHAHITQGTIFVKVDNGYKLDELHNVKITTGSLTPGQLLVRSGSNSTGVWINTNQLTGSYGLTGSLTATSFTGSLLGTASYALSALSASYAPVTIPSGQFGISNTSGSYTYYTTFSSSMAAATSGQTVEMFADITETTNISIALKDGVNINGNGHTYTLNQAGTANCVQDGGAAVNCSISNITFRRLGGTASSVNTICMYITGASRIKAYSTILIGGATNMRCLTVNNASAEVYGIYAEGYNPTITVTNGTLNDSTGKSLNGGGILVEASGKIVKCIGYGVNVGGINNSGLAMDCVAYDTGVGGFGNSGTAINCVGWSNNSGGFTCQGGSTNINCIGYSTAQIGFYSNGAINVISCKGYSSAGAGLAMINGAAYDSTGFSTTSYGIWVTNSGANATDLRSCRATSLAAIAIFMNNTTTGCKIYNTEAYSKWNNAAGHGIVVAGSNTEIVQCTIEVSNASANCISGSSTLTTKYANNAFKGSTLAINANITQGITNTHDNQGNILV